MTLDHLSYNCLHSVLDGDLANGGDVGSRITSFQHLTSLSLSANLVHFHFARGVTVAGVDVALKSSHVVLGKLVWFQ